MKTEDLSHTGLSIPAATRFYDSSPAPRNALSLLALLVYPQALFLLFVYALEGAWTTLVETPDVWLLLPAALLLLVELAPARTRSSRDQRDRYLPLIAVAAAALATRELAVRLLPEASLARTLAVPAALSALAALGFLRWGRAPLQLYREWLYQHVRLTADQRRRLPTDALLSSVIALAVLLGGAIVVSQLVSPAWAIAFLVSAGTLLVGNPLARLRHVRRILFLHLEHLSRADTHIAPGCWAPARSRRSRARAWGAASALVAVALAAITNFYALNLAPLGLSGTAQTVAEAALPALLSVIIPALVLLASLSPGQRALERTKAHVAKLIGHDERPPWEAIVERLRTSPVQTPAGTRERDHLFLGWGDGGVPLLLHRPILDEHAYITGAAGSGKTSRSLMPLLVQLIRGPVAPDGTPADRAPIVILDLKGDPALFHTAKEEAQRRGQAFRFFTLDSRRPAHRFNPLDTFCSRPRQPLELANQLIEALSLDYGDQYGKSYFAGENREALELALRDPRAAESFQSLYQAVRDVGGRRDLEIRNKLHALSGYDQLRSSSEDASVGRIHMPDVLEHGEVAYFFLDATTGAIGAREVGRVALFALLDAAIQRQRDGLQARRAYVVIDEFQVIATVNIEQIVQQARSFGLSLILANQSVEDLRVQGTNLLSVVTTNTRFKHFHSVDDPRTLEDLQLMSGETLTHRHSMSIGSSVTPQGFVSSSQQRWDEAFRPTLEPNRILGLSADRFGSIVHVRSGSGLTNFAGGPVPAYTMHCLTEAEYQRRFSAPLPPVEQPALDPRPPDARAPAAPARPRTAPPQRKVDEQLKHERAERLLRFARELEAREQADLSAEGPR